MQVLLNYEKLMARMNAAFINQGKEGIVKARAVEDRLMRDTWEVDGYDLLAVLNNCGHFSHLECPDGVRRNIDAFFLGRK